MNPVDVPAFFGQLVAGTVNTILSYVFAMGPQIFVLFSVVLGIGLAISLIMMIIKKVG